MKFERLFSFILNHPRSSILPQSSWTIAEFHQRVHDWPRTPEESRNWHEFEFACQVVHGPFQRQNQSTLEHRSFGILDFSVENNVYGSVATPVYKVDFNYSILVALIWAFLNLDSRSWATWLSRFNLQDKSTECIKTREKILELVFIFVLPLLHEFFTWDQLMSR